MINSTNPPKVLISYSHDSISHNERVLELFHRLRSDGIDCIIDQCEPSPSEGWPRWMDKQVRDADFVLMVCTKTYYERVMGTEESGKGLGVRWEGHLIYDQIYQNETTNTKFIPILLEPGKTEYIPNPLRAFSYYLAFTDEGYEDLYRRLTNQPRDLKPSLGKLRRLPPRERKRSVIDGAKGIIPKGLQAFDQIDKDFFLELLPGPRDSSGQPESIRFWSSRIESNDENLLRVGVMYGPSGCGKTSLVKAGLLPRVSNNIIPIYIESTAEDTEAKLLRRLQRTCSFLDPTLGLLDTIRLLDSGPDDLAHNQVLIVLDQFEQWLNAHPRPSESDELVGALSSLQNGNVKCLLMIRDDFWAATDRLFRKLGIEMIQADNFRLVDLFDRDHAKHVLRLFGIAYNRLPGTLGELSKDEQNFLSKAVDSLQKNGFVVPIRLSLFADLMKARSWTTASIEEMGGIEGIGIRFLEETFNSETSMPKYRAIQEPARKVLQALLPEQGMNLKREVKSRSQLALICGLKDTPTIFNQVLEVLDHELHLISPTEKGVEAERNLPSVGEIERYYQLTHDFMVAPLREWLTQERRRSWRGRAELALEERTAQWVALKRRRDLPPFSEFLVTILGVPRKKWTSDQKQLIGRAARHHLLILSLLLIVMATVTSGVWVSSAPLRARLLVQAILVARPNELQQLIQSDLAPYHIWADPILRDVVNAKDSEPSKKLRASLALVSSDSSQLAYLTQRLLDCDVDEYPVVRDILEPYHRAFEGQLWESFRTGATDKARFYAGMSLALYDPENDKWTKSDTEYIVDQLLKSNPDYQRDLRSYLMPKSASMLEPLRARFSDETQSDSIRNAAALALIDYQRGNAQLRAELISAATPGAYDVIFQSLRMTDINLQSVKTTLAEIAREEPTETLNEVERVRLGKKRAGAAITLLHLGSPEYAVDILKVQKDPEPITQFIHRLKERNVTASELLGSLDTSPDEQVRFALILALGEFKLEAIPNERQGQVVEKLLQWYRDDPSSAIHSASGWLLRVWGKGNEVAQTDQTSVDASSTKQWFVRRVGDYNLTFIVVKPGEFKMGSPDSEKGHQKNERLHSVSIARPFAICDREVTKSLFQTFLKETNRSGLNIDEWSPEDNDPVVKVSWYEAILFCRWLTIKAGMTEADQCYDDPEKLPKGADGFPITWTIHLDRRGFRLPTETEWEYSCRSGTTTTYSFGSDAGLLGYYGWFLNNSSSGAAHTTHIVATLRPNFWGLFDMHGNVWEWCDDWYGSKPGYDDLPSSGSNTRDRLIRSGSWHSDAGYSRSASRYVFPPETKDNLIGFRLVTGW